MNDDVSLLWSHEILSGAASFLRVVAPKKVFYGRKSQYAHPPARDKLSTTAMNSTPRVQMTASALSPSGLHIKSSQGFTAEGKYCLRGAITRRT